nr:MAG TPA: hypothetical protein [Caudoviricetes sp.]
MAVELFRIYKRLTPESAHITVYRGQTHPLLMV